MANANGCTYTYSKDGTTQIKIVQGNGPSTNASGTVNPPTQPNWTFSVSNAPGTLPAVPTSTSQNGASMALTGAGTWFLTAQKSGTPGNQDVNGNPNTSLTGCSGNFGGSGAMIPFVVTGAGGGI